MQDALGSSGDFEAAMHLQLQQIALMKNRLRAYAEAPPGEVLGGAGAPEVKSSGGNDDAAVQGGEVYPLSGGVDPSVQAEKLDGGVVVMGEGEKAGG